MQFKKTDVRHFVVGGSPDGPVAALCGFMTTDQEPPKREVEPYCVACVREVEACANALAELLSQILGLATVPLMEQL